MAFQEAAVPVSKLSIGTVIGLLNPKLMRQGPSEQQQHGITFSVELEAQLFKIGFSEDLSFCKGLLRPEGLQQITPVCRNFVNKSVETMCDLHKYHVQELQLAKIKSHRIGLQSDYIDINRMRKLQ